MKRCKACERRQEKGFEGQCPHHSARRAVAEGATKRLLDEIAKIKAAVQPISCEVCKKAMGFVEGDAPYAGYCSDKCIGETAKLILDGE